MSEQEKNKREAAELAEQWADFLAFHPSQLAQISSLEKLLRYSFKDKTLLYEALTHRSAVADFALAMGLGKGKTLISWNERLEFLGDSVLGLVISTMLWEREKGLMKDRTQNIDLFWLEKQCLPS